MGSLFSVWEMPMLTQIMWVVHVLIVKTWQLESRGCSSSRDREPPQQLHILVFLPTGMRSRRQALRAMWGAKWQRFCQVNPSEPPISPAHSESQDRQLGSSPMGELKWILQHHTKSFPSFYWGHTRAFTHGVLGSRLHNHQTPDGCSRTSVDTNSSPSWSGTFSFRGVLPKDRSVHSFLQQGLERHLSASALKVASIAWHCGWQDFGNGTTWYLRPWVVHRGWIL